MNSMMPRIRSAVRVAVCACAAAALPLLCAAQATPATLTIDTQDAGKPVSPTLYGLMTEEINHSYEGGLYAQLLSNHTFRNNWDGVESWDLIRNGDAAASVKLDKETGPSTALPTSLRITVTAASKGSEAGVSNVGYWGIPVRPHTSYHGSFYAKSEGVGPVTAKLVSDDTGAVLAETTVDVDGTAWKQYTYELKVNAATESMKNHLELTVAKPGTLWLQLATLFPPTYNDRPNGLRVDLMEKMAAMHPHFVRLPGGNYLEGDNLADWYNWKQTIGPLVDRPGHQAPWSYWSTDGLGLLEYLEWTEDLHVEPVLAVYAGYSLKQVHINPGKDLEPYVQAALDEVEYVTGDTSTKWGAERAKDGHPAPFPLHYIEIGNEDEFDHSGSYPERFAQFAVALHKKYPQYKLIATTPVKESEPLAQPDLIDDHYYKSPADMFDMVHKYDDAPRNGPQIFVGEWATRSGSPTPDFGDALGDAAWMTGLEHNSDLIQIASYAPLFVNVNPGAMQWPTDLIGYDALKSYGSPSYYAQVMFGANIGSRQPHSEIAGVHERFFYSVTKDDKALYVKLVNASNEPEPLALELKGLSAGAHVAKTTMLHAASFEATNSITDPERIHPVKGEAQFTGTKLQRTLAPYTIEVMEIPLH